MRSCPATAALRRRRARQIKNGAPAAAITSASSNNPLSQPRLPSSPAGLTDPEIGLLQAGRAPGRGLLVFPDAGRVVLVACELAFDPVSPGLVTLVPGVAAGDVRASRRTGDDGRRVIGAGAFRASESIPCGSAGTGLVVDVPGWSSPEVR